MTGNRLLELDALRGIAAMAVVIYHFVYRFAEIYGTSGLPIYWAKPGQYGVNLFFIVSGFVIYWTLNRTAKPMDFIVSRFSRLYPVFWACLLITSSVVVVLGLPGREPDAITVLTNFLMFHEYFSVPHVDGVYWTLTIELTFYFWIFLLFLTQQFKRVEYWLLIPIVLAALDAQGVIALPELSKKILITQYISFFLAGICFYKIANAIQTKTTYVMLLLSLAVSFVTHSIGEGLLFSCFYVVFYLAVTGRLGFLAVRPLVFLGTISYALYLLHQNIGYAMLLQARQFDIPELISIPIVTLIVVLLAYLATKLVEQPSIKWIRTQYKKSST